MRPVKSSNADASSVALAHPDSRRVHYDDYTGRACAVFVAGTVQALQQAGYWKPAMIVPPAERDETMPDQVEDGSVVVKYFDSMTFDVLPLDRLFLLSPYGQPYFSFRTVVPGLCQVKEMRMALDYVRYCKIPMYFRWRKWGQAKEASGRGRNNISRMTGAQRIETGAADEKRDADKCTLVEIFGSESDDELPSSPLQMNRPSSPQLQTTRTGHLLQLKRRAADFLEAHSPPCRLMPANSISVTASNTTDMFFGQFGRQLMVRSGVVAEILTSRCRTACHTRLLILNKSSAISLQKCDQQQQKQQQKPQFYDILDSQGKLNVTGLTLDSAEAYLEELDRAETKFIGRQPLYINDFGCGVDYTVEPTVFDTGDVRGLEAVARSRVTVNAAAKRNRPVQANGSSEVRRRVGRPRIHPLPSKTMDRMSGKRGSRSCWEDENSCDSDESVASLSDIDEFEAQALAARFCPFVEDPDVTIGKENEVAQLLASLCDPCGLPFMDLQEVTDYVKVPRDLTELESLCFRQERQLSALKKRYRDLSMDLQSVRREISSLKQWKCRAATYPPPVLPPKLVAAALKPDISIDLSTPRIAFESAMAANFEVDEALAKMQSLSSVDSLPLSLDECC